MESTRFEKIDSIEFYKYTKEQLFIKDKIRLGIILDNDDYLELYYDLKNKFNNTIEDEDIIQSTYIDYLDKKYNCTFKLSVIKKIILDQLTKEKGYKDEC
jgi:hypothetical protein